MDANWNDSQPIYRQLRDRVVAMILEGELKEGDPLPSVRNVAAEYRLNPLTVLKGYQQLVDEQLVEKRRGRGMFVSEVMHRDAVRRVGAFDEQLVEKRRGRGMFVNVGARAMLLKGERQRFLEDEWPKIRATIARLGFSPEELLQQEPAGQATTSAKDKDNVPRD